MTAADQLLLDSPLGWAGNRVMATMWFAAGQALPPALRDQLLDASREAQGQSPLAATCGSTSPQDAVIVLRVLAPRVEPIMALLADVWGRWRTLAWGVPPSQPRVWRT